MQSRDRDTDAENKCKATTGERGEINWEIGIDMYTLLMGSVVKKYTYQAGDAGSIPGLGRSPGEENGNPLQYSCLGNPMDRGVWWSTVHGVANELDKTEHLNHHNCIIDTMYKITKQNLLYSARNSTQCSVVT